MENLHKLSIEELVDILSTQTSLYIQMHTEGANDTEFQKCRQLIKVIQEEIKSRKEVKLEQPQ